MLTTRQADALRYILTYTRTNGVAPTYDEIMDGIGLSSKSGVVRLVRGLQDRGFIRPQNRHRAHRSLEIIRLPDGWASEPGVGACSLPSRVALIDQPGSDPLARQLQEADSYIDATPAMIRTANAHCGLRVIDRAMMMAGIIEGDVVIVELGAAPRPNDVVAVSIDGGPIGLRRFLRASPDGVLLRLEDGRSDAQSLELSKVRFDGRMVGLVRTLAHAA